MHAWKLSTLALASALVLTVGAGFVPDANADPQPRMQDALGRLQEAEKSLQNASDDKGGHRVKALAATREAIEQTKQGIAFDNKH
jgi:Spy/CpxP family protein refolding chaperone